MTKLSKTRRVLNRGYLRPLSATPLKRFGGDTSALLLDRQTWVDMGKPETVTITVEPGDLLND